MEENPAPVDMETLPLFTGFIYQSKVMQDVFHYQYPKPCLRRHLTITNPVHIFTAWIIRVKKTQLPSLTFRCEQKHVTSGLQVCSLNFIYFLTKDTTFWISIIEQISGISNHLLQPRLAWGVEKKVNNSPNGGDLQVIYRSKIDQNTHKFEGIPSCR